MVVVTRSKTRVDRLSKLPPELLFIIFDFVIEDDPTYATKQRLCLISKSLLPFGQSRLYHSVSIHEYARFDQFTRTINSRGVLAPIARSVEVVFELDESYRHRHPAGWTSPYTTFDFWHKLKNMSSITLGWCDGLIISFLAAQAWHQDDFWFELEAVEIVTDSSKYEHPLNFNNYRQLLFNAPNLHYLDLSVYPPPDQQIEPGSTDPTEYEDEDDDDLGISNDELSAGVYELIIGGLIGYAGAGRVAHFVNHFKHLIGLDLANSDFDFPHNELVRQLDLPDLYRLSLDDDAECWMSDPDPFSPT